MNQASDRSTARSNRRGTIYLIVLSTMVLCGVIASAGLILAGVAAGRVRASGDAARARLLAQSGIEMAADRMRQSTAWRSGLGAGGLINTLALDGGTIKLTATDPTDALIANSPDDSIVVTSEAQVGSARKMYKSTFVPNTGPVAALGYGLIAGGSITMTSSTAWSYVPLFAATGFSLSSSTMNANVVSGTTATGTTYAGTVLTGQAVPQFPVAATVIAEYAAMGTAITLNSSTTLDRVVFSPVSNPLGGGTNAKGVYVINCNGNVIIIRRSRINATLVLRNPASASLVRDSVCWDPAAAGYPSLIVEGNMTLSPDGADLNESSEGSNFNPSGSPYRGSSDSSNGGTYPSEFAGMVYVSGNLTITSATIATCAPIVCSGSISINSSTVKTRSTTQVWAPPAFRTSPEFLVTRSAFTRSVD